MEGRTGGEGEREGGQGETERKGEGEGGRGKGRSTGEPHHDHLRAINLVIVRANEIDEEGERDDVGGTGDDEDGEGGEYEPNVEDLG